ncbi:MAG: DMT family transporter [Deltaproteobacteria bacterium]|nr:DMT family transporter [Deltaproteobacteria bacterium]
MRFEIQMPVPRNVYLFLIVGLISASQSGNIVRLGEAHPVAIASWRLGIAALIMLPLTGGRLSLLKRLGKMDYVLLFMAGLALAAHFFSFIGAVQRTTVANATILFAMNPVITATAAYFLFKERMSVNLFLAITLGLIGAVFLGGNDLSLKPEHLAGDGLALLCTFFFSAYLLLGRKLRQTLPSMVYVSAVYGVAAIFGFLCLGFFDLPVVRYNGVTWLCFLLMALVPTVLGHTSFNHAIRYIGAGRISAATLSEPLLAGIVAFFAWGEIITWAIFLGYLFICASVLALVRDL